jgi:GNAT superfamily N-acetyltransferase
MKIIRGCPEDADELTSLALAAKENCGYPESWMDRRKEAFVLTPEYIRAHRTYVAVSDERIVGFCAFIIEAKETLIDHLWVAPTALGSGVGRALFEYVEAVARSAGAVRMKIAGGPNAEKVYVPIGAEIYGRKPAAADEHERFLLLLEQQL